MGSNDCYYSGFSSVEESDLINNGEGRKGDPRSMQSGPLASSTGRPSPAHPGWGAGLTGIRWTLRADWDSVDSL